MRCLSTRSVTRTIAPTTRPRDEDGRVDAGAIERHALYQSRDWRRLRKLHLADHPLCVACLAQRPPVYRRATVVDHVHGHVGDWRTRFFDPRELQSMCAACHSSKTIDDQRARIADDRASIRREIARLRAQRRSGGRLEKKRVDPP